AITPAARRRQRGFVEGIEASNAIEGEKEKTDLADRKDFLEIVCGAGNHMNADELADAPGRRRPGIGCGFYGRDIAADDGGDQARVDFLPADEDDVRGFD